MTELVLDTAAARAGLLAIMGETEAQGSRHAAGRPAFSVGAAGSGFSAQGKALATMLEVLHHSGATRIEALHRAASAAARQVAVFDATDHGLAAELGPLP